MIIKKKQDEKLQDIEVSVHYPHPSKEVTRLLSTLYSLDKQIHCTGVNREQLVNVSDIFYIESVDKKTFVYLETQVLQTELRLYQLSNELKNAGFVQISKSCVINLNVLESIRPLVNSRMEALLTNGEKVLVTRKYLSGIRKALQEDRV